MSQIATNEFDSIYTIVFTNKTLGRSVEEGLNVWVCENVTAFRHSLAVLRDKPHCRVISAGPSVVKRTAATG